MVLCVGRPTLRAPVFKPAPRACDSPHTPIGKQLEEDLARFGALGRLCRGPSASRPSAVPDACSRAIWTARVRDVIAAHPSREGARAGKGCGVQLQRLAGSAPSRGHGALAIPSRAQPAFSLLVATPAIRPPHGGPHPLGRPAPPQPRPRRLRQRQSCHMVRPRASSRLILIRARFRFALICSGLDALEAARRKTRADAPRLLLGSASCTSATLTAPSMATATATSTGAVRRTQTSARSASTRTVASSSTQQVCLPSPPPPPY